MLYALLSDALVRAKEEEQALAILSEGLAAFPEDAGLRRRLGMAYAMAGRAEEALPLLTAWVDSHPEDQGALFATLALLFEGFSRETAGAAPAEERQRLTRYAKAYVDGKGPEPRADRAVAALPGVPQGRVGARALQRRKRPLIQARTPDAFTVWWRWTRCSRWRRS